MWHSLLTCMLYVVASHHLSRLVLPPCAPTTVWFAMHVAVNMGISYSAAPSLARVLRQDPRVGVAHPPDHNYTPLFLAVLLHAYHCAVFDLSPDDRFHHILFAFIMGLPSMLYANDAVNAMLFAISGLPGAIIYTTILLRRLGCTSVSEPRVSALVNLLLRLPLVMWINASYLSTVARPPLPAVAVQVFLSSANAMGYSLQALARARRGARKK